MSLNHFHLRIVYQAMMWAEISSDETPVSCSYVHIRPIHSDKLTHQVLLTCVVFCVCAGGLFCFCFSRLKYVEKLTQWYRKTEPCKVGREEVARRTSIYLHHFTWTHDIGCGGRNIWMSNASPSLYASEVVSISSVCAMAQQNLEQIPHTLLSLSI